VTVEIKLLFILTPDNYLGINAVYQMRCHKP
jgi:hypothetical protein